MGVGGKMDAILEEILQEGVEDLRLEWRFISRNKIQGMKTNARHPFEVSICRELGMQLTIILTIDYCFGYSDASLINLI